MLAVTLAAAALSFGATAPAFAHNNNDDDGEGHHHGGVGSVGSWLNVPEPGACGEDGIQTLGLDPLASGVVHFAVEPVAGFVGLAEVVHYVNCSQVVPWEDSIDYQSGQWWNAVGLAQWQAALVANFCNFSWYC